MSSVCTRRFRRRSSLLAFCATAPFLYGCAQQQLASVCGSTLSVSDSQWWLWAAALTACVSVCSEWWIPTSYAQLQAAEQAVIREAWEQEQRVRSSVIGGRVKSKPLRVAPTESTERLVFDGGYTVRLGVAAGVAFTEVSSSISRFLPPSLPPPPPFPALVLNSSSFFGAVL